MSVNRARKIASFEEAIKEAKEQAEPRNFQESIEIQISLQNIKLERSENRFSARVVLPHPVAKRDRIGLFAADAHLSTLKELQEEMKEELTIISERKFNQIKTDPRAIKKLAKDVRIFLASVTLMGDIGKFLGRYLAPRNKMPLPLPIGSDVKEILQRAKRTVQIRLREDPIIYCKIGHEEMKREELAENAFALLQEITKNTPNRWMNIEEIGFKTTMGPRIEGG